MIRKNSADLIISTPLLLFTTSALLLHLEENEGESFYAGVKCFYQTFVFKSDMLHILILLDPTQC